MRLIIALFFFLSSSIVYAGHPQIFAAYGFGASHAVAIKTNQKTALFGFHAPILGDLYSSTHLGFFNDRNTTFFGFLEIGPRIKPLPFFYIENYVGVGTISRSDRFISGHFQFSIDGGAGFQDPITGNSIGINFKHISNGGIRTPNRGRNFWLLKVGISL